MIVVLDMRDRHPAGPFCAFASIEGLGELEVRGRTSAEARRKAEDIARGLAPRRLIFGLF